MIVNNLNIVRAVSTGLKPLVRAARTAYAIKVVGGSGFQPICLVYPSTTPFMAAISRYRFTAKVAASERSTIPAKASQKTLGFRHSYLNP